MPGLVSLSVSELAQWLQDTTRPAPVLLDVREAWEFEHCALASSVHMPMGLVPVRYQELATESDVVCICHHGGRSMQVAMWLQQRGFEKVYNLTGGIDAWARQVDPKVPVY
jgi:rhodanese-related sulfurtransferase